MDRTKLMRKMYSVEQINQIAKGTLADNLVDMVNTAIDDGDINIPTSEIHLYNHVFTMQGSLLNVSFSIITKSNESMNVSKINDFLYDNGFRSDQKLYSVSGCSQSNDGSTYYSINGMYCDDKSSTTITFITAKLGNNHALIIGSTSLNVIKNEIIYEI